MSAALAPIRKPHQLHIRLAEESHRGIARVARELHISASDAVALLAEEALKARRERDSLGPADAEELQLHVLVGVEQLLALMESIHPKGPGVATEVLPAALAAARRRVDPREGN